MNQQQHKGSQWLKKQKKKKENSTEEEEHECEECPPKGAPAWMATFADMATLLMAFFVLILSFAEFNVPKFKQISGSLKMLSVFKELFQ